MVPKHPRKQHKQVAGLYRPTRKTGHTRYVIQPIRAFATRIGMLSIAQLIGMLHHNKHNEGFRTLVESLGLMTHFHLTNFLETG